MSYKAGYVGLIGMPNAGKSTLANAMIGEKIAIVTRKAQTTRKRILGILSGDDYQIVLADAPGVVQNKRGINSFLVDEYQDVIHSSDVLVAVLNIDAKSEQEIEKILNLVVNSGKPWFAVVTKNDLGMIHRIEKIKYKIRDMGGVCIELSAKKSPKDAKMKILEQLVPLLPESPGPFYDPELYTTSSVRSMVEEMIREQCFENLHDEIPYGLAVQIRKYTEEENIHRIHADILIEKEAHKQIVVGKAGQGVLKIGTHSRIEIEKLIGCQVYLELFVKVKESWTQEKNTMRELGYVVSK